MPMCRTALTCETSAQAVEAFLKGPKTLPVNVKVNSGLPLFLHAWPVCCMATKQDHGLLLCCAQFLFEGQEEIGSPNLSELLKTHKALLAADLALSADGGQISETQARPTLRLSFLDERVGKARHP